MTYETTTQKAIHAWSRPCGGDMLLVGVVILGGLDLGLLLIGGDGS